MRTYLEGRARTIGAEVKAQVIEDEGLPLYVNLRLLAGDPGELVGLARIAKMAVADGWTVDLGGSNLSVLPPYVSKRLAVEHLLGAMGPDTLTVGIGDSLGDLGFISRCDFAAMPRGSRLFRAIEANAV